MTVAAVLLGLAGVAVGAGGLFLSLTTDATPPDRGADVLGSFACEPAEREPRAAPSAEYAVGQVVTDGRHVTVVERDASAARLTLVVDGELVGAEATRFVDGPDRGPTASTANGTVTVTDPARAPSRLWVDTVASDGTLVRTELDVCPPAERTASADGESVQSPAAASSPPIGGSPPAAPWLAVEP